jgi:hypothetical protein
MLRKIILSLLTLLGIWIATDLWVPRHHDLRQFNPTAIGVLETKMWRSYYEKKPLLLFWQSAQLFRWQLKAPFWRSFKIAYHATKAAFIFKNGTNRKDYNRALPNLQAFYREVARLSNRPLEVDRAAEQELEWWIIRRYREEHPPEEWTKLQAQVAAGIYGVASTQCETYGALRTEAMLYRDNLGEKIGAGDWKKIEVMLIGAWGVLKKDIH